MVLQVATRAANDHLTLLLTVRRPRSRRYMRLYVRVNKVVGEEKKKNEGQGGRTRVDSDKQKEPFLPLNFLVVLYLGGAIWPGHLARSLCISCSAGQEIGDGSHEHHGTAQWRVHQTVCSNTVHFA